MAPTELLAGQFGRLARPGLTDEVRSHEHHKPPPEATCPMPALNCHSGTTVETTRSFQHRGPAG